MLKMLEMYLFMYRCIVFVFIDKLARYIGRFRREG